MDFREIPVDQITVSEFNTRKDLGAGTEDSSLDDLAASIREKGLLNPCGGFIPTFLRFFKPSQRRKRTKGKARLRFRLMWKALRFVWMATSSGAFPQRSHFQLAATRSKSGR